MKKLFAKHRLIQGIVGAVVMLILPAAHAQYWGNWTQDTATTLHSDYPSYGTVYLTVSASLSPSASVVTGTFPSSGWGTIPAAGAYSGLNTLPGSNTFLVNIDLTHYNVSDGQSLFGFSDVASIGYGGAPITYSIKAFDSSGHWISTYDWTPIYDEPNSEFSTDDATLTINSSTGVLVFDNPQANHDSEGYFFPLAPGTASIQLEALSTTGGDGMRFYIGSPEVPEPGTCALLGLGVAGLIGWRQTRRQK
jgi:hypothetical protein